MFKNLTVNNKCECEMNIVNNKQSPFVSTVYRRNITWGTNVMPANGNKKIKKKKDIIH